MENPIITAITIISTFLSVTSTVGAVCLIGYTIVQVARKLYWHYCLKYDVAYIADAKVTNKFFNGNPAQSTDPAPMFDDVMLVVTCNGVDYIFNDEESYERFQMGQTVKLMANQGYNRRGEMKNTYFTIEEK